MNQTASSGVPERILLATDLSARCDRALDRAVQLATEWDAKLILLTVLEERKSPDELHAWLAGENDTSRARFVRRQLARELAALPIPAETLIGEGDVADGVRKAATTSDAGLVITGMARSETFGRYLVGTTPERLARTLRQPLLVVRGRAREPYSRILVATDFSETSQHALRVALRLFPDRAVVLYHAFPARAYSDDTLARRLILTGECADFLRDAELSPADRDRLQVVIEPGSVEAALPRHAREYEVELVVLGTQGRSRLMSVLLGSSAAELLEWLPCDTMLVRQPQ